MVHCSFIGSSQYLEIPAFGKFSVQTITLKHLIDFVKNLNLFFCFFQKIVLTTVPAPPTSVTTTTSCRTLPNPPNMPISVVMTSEGAKVSLLSQMVAATSKFSATTASLSSPGLRSLLGPNGVSLPVTPPKTPENNQTITPTPTPPSEIIVKKTSTVSDCWLFLSEEKQSENCQFS